MVRCQEPGDLAELHDTVKAYGRHVLALAGDMEFGPRVEQMEGTLVGTMGRDVKVVAATEDLERPPKFTPLRTPTEGREGLDLLVFPDRVRYRGITEATWPRVRDEHLKDGEPVADLDPEPLEGIHITVCTHMARDERCGACGPLVIAALEEAVEARGLEDEVAVHASTHVGGHRYAGNVLVYPGGAWYGYVRPGDVDALLEAAVSGNAWEAHHRGGMLTP